MTPYDLLAYRITAAWASGGLLVVGLWASLAVRNATRRARAFPVR